MIKFRQKLFYVAPSIVWEDLIVTDFVNYPVIFNIHTTSQFEEGRKTFLQMYKKKISRFLEDLENGFIYTDAQRGDKTEYLDQISIEKTDGTGRLVYSKYIVGDDRFCYYILTPYKSGNNTIITIVVYSCKGHVRPEGGSYWDPDELIMEQIQEEINEWRKKLKLSPI